MKKNGLFLLILAVLLGITYYAHESGDVRRKTAFQKKHQLFKPELLGEMMRFENKVATIVKKDQRLYLEEQAFLVDQRQFQAMSEVLAQIQAVRFLEKEELAEIDRALLFPRDDDRLKFAFEGGEVEYLIGEKLAFDQTFYLEIRWRYKGEEDQIQTVIARDASPEQGVYFQETYHNTDQKYRKLVTLLYLDQQVFSEKRPLLHFVNPQISRVSFVNKKNRPYTLSLDKVQTEPPLPHNDLEYAKDRFKTFLEQLADLEASRVVFFDMTKENQQPEASLIFTTAAGNIEWQIFRSNDNSKELLLKTVFSSVTFVFEEMPEIFFYPLSYFWEKTPKDLDLEFQADVTPEQRQKMLELFSQEADSIEEQLRWSDEAAQRLSESTQRYVVYSLENELQLWDTQRQLVYRYNARRLR